MTPLSASTLSSVLRATGTTARQLDESIRDGSPIYGSNSPKRPTLAQCKEMRQTGAWWASNALKNRLPTVHTLGIDPGRHGAMVGLDAEGRVIFTAGLYSLHRDESPTGPAAKKAAYRAEQAAIAEENSRRPPSRRLKGRKKKVTSIKGALWRLDMNALDFLLGSLEPITVAIEGLLHHNIDLTSQEVYSLPRNTLAQRVARARESIKGHATMVANHERLTLACRYAGITPIVVTPRVWQAGWSDAFSAVRLADAYGGHSDHSDHKDPKWRSLAAAKIAGFAARSDAESDAYGIARWAQKLQQSAPAG